MPTVAKSQIEAELKTLIDPYLGKDLVSADVVKRIEVNNNEVSIALELGFPAKNYESDLSSRVSACLTKIDGIDKINIDISTKIICHAALQGVKPLSNVKNIIPIASGKGGVGKSTTAVNLALALAKDGANVGILDADIYGPSQPRMLGISNKPDSKDGKTMEPLMSHGIQAMSIGFLIDEETPMIWRGPMVTQALEQLLNDTNWNDLDYLIIDMPPGTGDIQLSMSQKVPISGAVIVTTPQDIALLDARKGLKMFEKVNVPILGIIENMSLHICSSCGHEEPIFGQGGGKKMATEYNIDFLGSLPLDIQIREQADSGNPTVVAEPEGRITQIYLQIARRISAKLSLQAKDYSNKFPNIVIQNN